MNSRAFHYDKWKGLCPISLCSDEFFLCSFWVILSPISGSFLTFSTQLKTPVRPFADIGCSFHFTGPLLCESQPLQLSSTPGFISSPRGTHWAAPGPLQGLGLPLRQQFSTLFTFWHT